MEKIRKSINPDRYSGTAELCAMEYAKSYNNFILKKISEFQPNVKGTLSLLDFGAGKGSFATAVRNQGGYVCAVEPDFNLRCEIQKKDIDVYESLNDIQKTFDYVFSVNVLEHINDDMQVLKDIYGKTRAGGRLFLYVPAFQVLYSPMDRQIGHFRRYRKQDLSKKLEKAGFKPVTALYCDSVGFFATLILKILGKMENAVNPRSIQFYDTWLFPISRKLDFFLSPILGKNLIFVAEK